MAAKKSNKPEDPSVVRERKKARKQYVGQALAAGQVKSRKQGRRRFYVQTRAQELGAKGVEVTPEMRKKLRKKFNAGKVKREGFYAPSDKRKKGAKAPAKRSVIDRGGVDTAKKVSGGTRSVAKKAASGARRAASKGMG